MDCVEFHYLNDTYERRRRAWLSYAFPLPGQYLEGPDELEREALLDRNIAAKRLENHQKKCPICRAG
jgi:hypothetical protein